MKRTFIEDYTKMIENRLGFNTSRARAKLLRNVACLLVVILSRIASGAQVQNARLELGGNVNERFQWATPEVLEQTHTTWLRGFIPASEFMSGRRSFASDPGLEALKRAANSGHRVVLSIKWDSTGSGEFGRMPEAGSQKEQEAFAFVDHLLDATAGKVSALVLINELFIDTLPADLMPGPDGRIPVIAFLRRLATHIDAEHRTAANGSQLPLYAGGMTRLDLPTNQLLLSTRLMIRFIKEDPRITGADFHLHEPDMQCTQDALAFMHRAIPDKPLMVSEMSLVIQWKEHLGDRIDNSKMGHLFVQQFGLRPGMTVAEFLNSCFQQPVPEEEWQWFLASQPWFEPHYLAHLVPILQANGVRIATYGLTWNPNPGQVQPTPHVSSETTPWFLNQLLVPGLVIAPGATQLPENYGFFQDYVNYQDGR